MTNPAISIDYGNVLESAVGAAHGLTRGDLKRAESSVKQAVRNIERERKTGLHRYRDLPDDRQMLRQVSAAAKRRGAGIENLVVLGIGGSALGNVALQTALNHPYYNLLSAKERGGPRLFVMDNVDPVQVAGMLDTLGASLRRTLFNVISKSGETAETAAQFLIVRDLIARYLAQERTEYSGAIEWYREHSALKATGPLAPDRDPSHELT